MQKIGDIFSQKKTIKPPAYEWQDLALKIIHDLAVPNFKRSAVFKVCKENPRAFVEKCFDETKELAHSGESWRYFFKLIDQGNSKTYEKK
ncbi:MAG: hypothetical protein WC465_00745 [Patescibacteria group bacterium]